MIEKSIKIAQFIIIVLCMTACGNVKSTNVHGESSQTDDISEVDSELSPIIVINEMENNQKTDSQVSSEEIDDKTFDQGSEELVGKDMQEIDSVKNIEEQFYIEEISDELFDKMYGKSYKENCTIPREELSFVHVMHFDFNGDIKEGEIVCNRAIAADLIEIFKELYFAEYPIEKIRLVDEYDADDERSMADNNSSCFNFRFISHTTTVSNHGKGLAIDINPLYNPYVKTVDGKLNIEPANAGEYVDRDRDFPYKIDENDLAYKSFTEHGFTWGGAWKNSKDYQHFEKKVD